ncbi:GNAT family N-acetyltransferase [Vreelandella nigrificans]|uniref:GNAT family N-acetyltransferase n=1 Tax=Vreelandella nigrificans TaxID=2042704 RepID=A0A2A4HGM8_9GAMM|nr:GNAT family N-acetyltransferase [Halomonas nigrificans]PCF93880.1 GNAT family N-acetyltransferase [Halomonas nigrificans]
MKITYRRAVPEDTPECIALRGKTRENAFSVEQLMELGITLDSWKTGISDGSLPGYVGISEGEIIGYCFGDRKTGEIVVLALLPEYESKGIGRALLNRMIENFKALGFERLFLGCSSDPNARSYGFYRHLGWRSTGIFDDADDEVLEFLPAQSKEISEE